MTQQSELRTAVLRVALDLPKPMLFDYLAPPGAAAAVGARVRVPFGRGAEKVGVVIEIGASSAVAGERLKPALAVLEETGPLPADWLDLVGFAARYYGYPLGAAIASALPPAMRRTQRLPRPRRDPLYRASAAGLAAMPALPAASPRRRLLEALQSQAVASRSTLAGGQAGAAAALDRLFARGWIEPAEPATEPTCAARPQLLQEQSEAVTRIAAALGGFGPFLLHGVTGSGKTEVYLGAIEAALARGLQALMLVPEIALTPQLEQRVRARFPAARLICLHSELAAGERTQGFIDALGGEADIVLGTRLAVFVPLARLGLIVVDEEHDASFKQQEGFRYHARDVAVWRAKQRGVPIVLGSATPALETWHHAGSGRYCMLRLTRRATRAELPAVSCLDTRKEKLDHGIGPRLIEAIGRRLALREQSLVFLNRRGYAPVLACPACGWVSRCRHCAANMVLHLADRALRCHHCGAGSSVPGACPGCGNQDIHPFGRGTQRVESRLGELFPQARILRIDRDSMRSRQAWQEALAQVHAGAVDILVGTQMLAKGHDFPRLTLVGVLNADASLFAADYRAPERLFGQLMQVGGRSGRAALPGEVLVQTEYPDHPLYAALMRHDWDGFAAAQLDERRQAGFPPWAFQALLQADAPRIALALEFLREALELARTLVDAAITLYDPVPMRLARKADRERAQLLVESRQRPPLQAFLRRWLAQLHEMRPARELRWHLDVDPGEL